MTGNEERHYTDRPQDKRDGPSGWEKRQQNPDRWKLTLIASALLLLTVSCGVNIHVPRAVLAAVRDVV
jgi:hypothetical protein